jgi:hypothetical protein
MDEGDATGLQDVFEGGLGFLCVADWEDAPVEDSARAVSMPIPELDPVRTITLSVNLPSMSLSEMIWTAVGRASPAPLALAWA